MIGGRKLAEAILRFRADGTASRDSVALMTIALLDTADPDDVAMLDAALRPVLEDREAFARVVALLMSYHAKVWSLLQSMPLGPEERAELAAMVARQANG